MSLQNILDKIASDAQEEAEGILAESRSKAEEIKARARKEAEELAAALIQEAVRKGKLEASRILTQARLEKKIKILSCKKELIAEVLERAFENLGSDKKRLKRKVILKDGEKEEAFDEKKLKEELQPQLENYIAEILKI